MNSVIANRNILTRITVKFILLSALAAGTFGQSAPVSDAHIHITSANGNYGSNPQLTVSGNNTAFVKFAFVSTLPAGTKGDDVAKATVRFYVNKVATAGKLDLHPVLGEWDETTITANNAPQIGPPALTTPQFYKQTQGNYVLIDITDLVKHWLGDGMGQNALPNYGFALTSHPVDPNTPELADINFDSKENSQTSHDGVLSIQLERGLAEPQSIATDATLVGDGLSTNPLGVAPGAITSTQLADSAVTSNKIVNAAVTSVKIAVPLSLAGASPDFTLSVANAGSGPALTAQGPINTSMHYNIGGARFLTNWGADNTIVGEEAGKTTSLLVGGQNSFFGRSAGRENINGQSNSFFGMSAGQGNTGGHGNSFFGTGSGINNTTGNWNSFFGIAAGRNNTMGFENTFFGISAGFNNLAGNDNTFIGGYADFTPGTVNTTGNNNILLGAYSELSPNISNATAIGWRAMATQNNTLVLGSISGVNFGTDTNVGIGTSAPKTKFHLKRGRIYIESNGQGLIMKSQGGSCFELTVSDQGVLTILATACP